MVRIEVIHSSDVRSAEVAGPFAVFKQRYEAEPKPGGVEIVKTPVFTDERGGHFLELVRMKDGLIKVLAERGVNLDIRDGQVNASIIVPGTERFGHLHRDQDELWMVAAGVLTVGLFDARHFSETAGLKTKLVLSAGTGVYIPHGVVHGLANYGDEKAVLVYFPNIQFSSGSDTQEWRAIPEDPGFWDFARPDKI